jgi:hypothetical protein
MKRVMMIVAVMLIGGGSVTGAYTYTYGPGEYISVSHLYSTESMLVDGAWGVSVTCDDQSFLRVESTAPADAEHWAGITSLRLVDYSRFEMTDGEIRDRVQIGFNAQAVIDGGRINAIDIGGFARMTLSGGQISVLNSYQPVLWIHREDLPGMPWVKDTHIDLLCKDYLYNAGTHMLTGTWGDDSSFSIHLYDMNAQYTAIENINFITVPEPMTLALFGLGGILARRYARC